MTVDDPYYAHFRSRPLPHVFQGHDGTDNSSGEDLPKWAEVKAAWDILRILGVMDCAPSRQNGHVVLSSDGTCFPLLAFQGLSNLTAIALTAVSSILLLVGRMLT